MTDAHSDGMTWVENLLHLDYRIMLYVNRSWSHPLLDDLALLFRESIFHVPLYLFLLLFAFRIFGKNGWYWLLGAGVLIGISDLVSSHLIKEWVGRPRPCRDPVMAHQIRFLAKYCGMNGSFTSSHAFNHFAFATYAHFTLRKHASWMFLLYPWAALIAYSQVYVGVHYPSDVMAGALLGIVFGWAGQRIVRQPLSLHPLQS